MNQQTKDELEDLSLQYKEAYAEHQTTGQRLEVIKEQIKALAKDDFSNDTIKVSHLSTQRPQYKEMIADAGIKIPDKYIKTISQTRITFIKQPVESL